MLVLPRDKKEPPAAKKFFGSDVKIWLQAHKEGRRVAGRGEIELLREVSRGRRRLPRIARLAVAAVEHFPVVSAPGPSPGSAARPASRRRRPGTGRRGRSRRSAGRRGPY